MQCLIWELIIPTVNIAATAQDVLRKSPRDNLRPAEPSTGNLLI